MSDVELRQLEHEGGLTPELMRARHRAMLCPMCGEKERGEDLQAVPECCCVDCWYVTFNEGPRDEETMLCPGCPMWLLPPVD